MTISSDLIQAVIATAELCGAVLSAPAAELMVHDLAEYPASAVAEALQRVRRERCRFTLAEIIARIDDGRPGAEEAWAMIPKNESDSVVWTEEMAEAWGVASAVYYDGDEVGARMAFREIYTASVTKARGVKTPVRWMPSLGHDPSSRETALAQAITKQRIGVDHALRLVQPERQVELLKLARQTDHPLMIAAQREEHAALPAPGRNVARLPKSGAPAAGRQILQGLIAQVKGRSTPVTPTRHQAGRG